MNFSRSPKASPFKTPQFLDNVGRDSDTRPATKSSRRVLIVSDFDHTLTRNDCGAEVAQLVGMPSDVFFAEARAIGERKPTVERGGEFAALALEHPKFAAMTPQILRAAARRVELKDNVGELIRTLNGTFAGFEAHFYVVSAGPQPTVRAALADVGVSRDNVIGSRFELDATSSRAVGLIHVSAGAGKVEIIRDLKKLLGVPGENVIYFGDGSSDIAAMKYVQAHKGHNVAVEDHPELRPFRSRLFVSNDAASFLLPVAERISTLKQARKLAGAVDKLALKSPELNLGKMFRSARPTAEALA